MIIRQKFSCSHRELYLLLFSKWELLILQGGTWFVGRQWHLCHRRTHFSNNGIALYLWLRPYIDSGVRCDKCREVMYNTSRRHRAPQNGTTINTGVLIKANGYVGFLRVFVLHGVLVRLSATLSRRKDTDISKIVYQSGRGRERDLRCLYPTFRTLWLSCHNTTEKNWLNRQNLLRLENFDIRFHQEQFEGSKGRSS